MVGGGHGGGGGGHGGGGGFHGGGGFGGGFHGGGFRGGVPVARVYGGYPALGVNIGGGGYYPGYGGGMPGAGGSMSHDPYFNPKPGGGGGGGGGGIGDFFSGLFKGGHWIIGALLGALLGSFIGNPILGAILGAVGMGLGTEGLGNLWGKAKEEFSQPSLPEPINNFFTKVRSVLPGMGPQTQSAPQPSQDSGPQVYQAQEIAPPPPTPGVQLASNERTR